MVIYLVDSTIHLLNNRGLELNEAKMANSSFQFLWTKIIDS